MLLQRFNAVLHQCLPAVDCADSISYLFAIFSTNFSSEIPREGFRKKDYTEGIIIILIITFCLVFTPAALC